MNNSEPINEELLSAYLDGELSEAESLRVEKQIEQDDSLRATLSELKKIRDEIRQLPRHKLSSDFAAKITQSIEQQQSETPQPTVKKSSTPPRRLAGTLAAVAALLFFSVWGIRYLPNSQHTAMTQTDKTAVDGVDMRQQPVEPALELQKLERADQLPEAAPMNSIADTVLRRKAKPESFNLPQARERRIDDYDLVVDYELDTQDLDLVSTSLHSWKKVQAPAENDASLTEYVIEGTPDEIRIALVALRSAPSKQLAETRLGQDYKNRFFRIDRERFDGSESLAEADDLSNGRSLAEENSREAGGAPTTSIASVDDLPARSQARENSISRFAESKADPKAVAPGQGPAESAERQSLSLRFEEVDQETEFADSEASDTTEKETTPVQMRVLVRIRNK